MSRGVLAFAVVMLLIIACSRSDPERELRATIAAMADAVEQREPAVLLAAVADDFSRESSAFGKEDARRLLAGIMLRNARIQVDVVVTEVRIDGAHAEAKMRILATGGAGILPERGQTWEFDTFWRRADGRWQVFNADWREGL